MHPAASVRLTNQCQTRADLPDAGAAQIQNAPSQRLLQLHVHKLSLSAAFTAGSLHHMSFRMHAVLCAHCNTYDAARAACIARHFKQI